MAKIFAAQNLPADVSQVMDQLERHCLAPDGSLISKSTYYDLQLAVYIEAMAMVEEYQQAVSVANLGGIRDVQGLYPQLGLRNSPQDITEYQVLLAREIASRLDAKCDKLADAVVIDDMDSSSGHQNLTSRLPERVKLIIEEIEREELAWREDLYSSDRKFAEYYNDELQKTWLCKRCETMSAKLRKYLVESTEEASLAYNKAVTRLREYQGVDAHFDIIARQYHDIVKKLENMQWTIHQVEMDLKRLPDHPSN
ncbi:AUGMIN subunit [Sesamum angolense]|uniref:AUGMIN subunit n=1 Tax=Sesamum angolense TaxID=2727404 RepID=A0AAE1WS18_9LAMI|nr:AUGMIN subunit [Sesamum angolense]